MEMEFVWRPYYDYFGNATQIFTHILYDHYGFPSMLRFEGWDGSFPLESDGVPYRC